MSEITNLKVSNVLYDIKEKREVGHNLVTSLSNLDGSKNRVIANLSGPSTLSINSSKPMNVGSTMYIACKPSMSFQQSLQGTGLHCVKDNINAKKDTPFTIKITCFAPNQYFVVVYDEMYTWVDVVITGVNGAEMVNLEVDDASDGTHSNVHSFTNVKEDINITTKSIDGGFIFRAKKPGFKEFYKTGHFKFGEVNTINVVFEELPKFKDPRTVVPGDVLMKTGEFLSINDINEQNVDKVSGVVTCGWSEDTYNTMYKNNRKFHVIRVLGLMPLNYNYTSPFEKNPVIPNYPNPFYGEASASGPFHGLQSAMFNKKSQTYFYQFSYGRNLTNYPRDFYVIENADETGQIVHYIDSGTSIYKKYRDAYNMGVNITSLFENLSIPGGRFNFYELPEPMYLMPYGVAIQDGGSISVIDESISKCAKLSTRFSNIKPPVLQLGNIPYLLYASPSAGPASYSSAYAGVRDTIPSNFIYPQGGPLQCDASFRTLCFADIIFDDLSI